MSHWISVDDDEPAWTDQVIVGRAGKQSTTASLEHFGHSDGGRFSENGYEPMAWTPTHWQPMPAPPPAIRKRRKVEPEKGNA